MSSLPQYRRQDGASAVEFAIIFPILLLIVFGIVDFGYAYFHKISLNAAVREGVREIALHDDATSAQTRAQSTFGAEPLTFTGITGCPSGAGGEAELSASYAHSYITPLPSLIGASSPLNLASTGVMRCGG